MSAGDTKQVLRFLIAGGAASAINWLLRFPLSQIAPFGAAVILAQIAGMVVGFVLYRQWVFSGARSPLSAQLTGFVLVNSATLVIVFAAALVGRALLLQLGLSNALAEAIAHGAAIGLGAVANYFGHKTISFRRTVALDPAGALKS